MELMGRLYILIYAATHASKFYLYIGLLAMSACNAKLEESLNEHYRSALQSAASDLFQLGLHKPALDRLEEACRIKPSELEARHIAALYEERGDAGSGAACLERLFPYERSDEMNESILNSYLKGGRWREAKKYLIGRNEDPRLLKLNNIMSHGKILREAFNKPHALNWTVDGCKVDSMNGLLILSSGFNRWIRTDGMGFYASLGWMAKISYRVLKSR